MGASLTAANEALTFAPLDPLSQSYWERFS